MLSEGKAMNKLEEKKRLRSLPVLERPLTVRLKFRKVGSLQYISHLDLQRTFMRVLVRACIPVWYTKGFNPHAKLVFSTPLSVGAQSEYEFLDLRIDRDMAPEEIMERLNRELTEELCITEAYLPTSDFSEIAWASYELEIATKTADRALAEAAEKLLQTSPLIMVKRTKAGEKEIDIVSMIREIHARFDEETGTVKLSALLKANVGEFLNPEMLVSAMKDYLDILAGDPTEEWYSILRTAIYKEDMTLFR
ncbi:MAG: TIGR03936 family radical SAM-associated protein [Clostridia bacterium]|nr:TIGR03936 family radical SAM-associated protein [Clostridia bacterium]